MIDSHVPVLHDPQEVCSLISHHRSQLNALRDEAFKQVLQIFQAHPNRIYRYRWPKAYEWDSELYLECPYIKYFSGRTVQNCNSADVVSFDALSGIYVDNNVIMVATNRAVCPAGDVIDIEVILESLLSAHNVKDMKNNGFYYEDKD